MPLKAIPLSSTPLCGPGSGCDDDYLVNTVAVSDNGSRVIGATYYYPYGGTTRTDTSGLFGTYCFDRLGNLQWKDEFQANEGVYAVAISGDGSTVVSGGLLKGGKGQPDTKGLIRIHDGATGKRLADFSGSADAQLDSRVNAVAISADGSVVAGVSNKLFVFIRRNDGTFPEKPFVKELCCYPLDSVAVHPSGNWLAFTDEGGNVGLCTVTTSGVSEPVRLTERRFFSKQAIVAIARKSDFFTVGSDRFVGLYKFTPGQTKPPSAIAMRRVTEMEHGVRWVSIADDGSFIVAATNEEESEIRKEPGKAPEKPKVGMVGKLVQDGNVLKFAWRQTTAHNPNSTSVDSSGTKITVADGHPYKTPGAFYLFDGDGNKLAQEPTVNMNWPLVVSADGSVVVGGSDDNKMYYLTASVT